MEDTPVIFSGKPVRILEMYGYGSVVNLDCRDGKKCRDGDNSGTEEVGFDFEFHFIVDSPGLGRDAPVN